MVLHKMCVSESERRDSETQVNSKKSKQHNDRATDTYTRTRASNTRKHEHK